MSSFPPATNHRTSAITWGSRAAAGSRVTPPSSAWSDGERHLDHSHESRARESETDWNGAATPTGLLTGLRTRRAVGTRAVRPSPFADRLPIGVLDQMVALVERSAGIAV